MTPREPRRPCPHCGRDVAVSRSTETVRRHRYDGRDCPGTGTRVDLWSE